VALTIEEIYRSIRGELADVEACIRESVPDDLPVLSPAAQHILTSGGKRLRAVLVLLCAKLCKGEGRKPINYAAAVELMHVASLVYDDLFSESLLRRGRQTVNGKWGEDIAFLLGTHFLLDLIDRLVGENRAVRTLMTPTAMGMLRGEVDQFASRNKTDLTESEYLQIIEQKSASFLSACCQLGAATNGTSKRASRALGEYGRNLGIAFQIRDDVLGLTADQKKLGKPVGSDIEEGRVTVPLIHGLKLGSKAQRLQLLRLYNRKTKLRKGWLKKLNSVLSATGSFDYAIALSERYAAQAKESLAPLPSCRERDALATLADFVVHRDL